MYTCACICIMYLTAIGYRIARIAALEWQKEEASMLAVQHGCSRRAVLQYATVSGRAMHGGCL